MIRKLAFASLVVGAMSTGALSTAALAQQPNALEKAGAAAAGAANQAGSALSNAAAATANAAADAAQTTKNAATHAAHATARVVNGWVADLDALKDGWTLKRSVIGQSVYNEKNERIGEIDDIILLPQTNIAYAVVGVGGFLGIGEHDVVTPLATLSRVDGKFVMPGVSKDTVKAAPRYTYTR